MTPSAGEPPLRLLALDGGGIRGLSELLMIKGIMHRLMVEENKKLTKDGQAPLINLPKPCDYFDLIGGTSTGGIIALMLGRLRMDVDTAIKRYDDLAKDVFSDPKRWGGDGKFKAGKLEEAIKSMVEEKTGDSESLLLEGDEAGICRTFVCAMNAHNMTTPVLFRTYQCHEIPFDCKIWEAARATTAAPAFFKRIEIGRGQPFIDGGLGRNNPSRLVLDEAKGLFSNRQIGCLVSIGTGQAEIVSMKKPGLFQWIGSTDVVNALNAIATDCEATHETMLRLFANSQDTYFRLNVDRGMQRIELSEWEKLANVEAHTTQYMKRKEVDEKLALVVNTMRVPRPQLTIEQLISPRPQVEIQRVKERKLCPLPVATFTGRKEILDKMHAYFDSDAKCQRVFVLHGLGGSGKSQIAFKFLQESQANDRFSDIFYIDATNEQTLEMDLMAITPGNAEQSVDASRRWLTHAHDGNWLLFFDNADDVQLKLKRFFPACLSGNILVTTRNQELRLYATKDSSENIKGMDHEDSTNLLLNLSQADETDENKALAAHIVKDLHHFALAVSQAGAFIRCQSSLRDYRELYQSERDNLLQNAEVQDPDPYGLAVYTTWRLSYDQLTASARSFLQICSMLHHEGISEQMFKKAALSPLRLEDSELQKEVTELLNQLGKRDSNWSTWDFLQVIKCLRSYSLIEYDARNCTYSLHPLVQHWSGTTIGENKEEMKKYVLSIIGVSISWTFDMEDYIYRQNLLKHITNCTARLNPEEMDPLVALRLALIYSEQGHWRDAEKLQLVATEKRKRLLGEDHPDTLSSMGNLARTYGYQGRWMEAEKLELVVTEKTKRLLGEDHPDTLLGMGNLARTYADQGRWKEAEELELLVMKKKKQLLGEDHPDTLSSMGNLASTYTDQGRWKEAEKLQLEVAEKRKRLLGEEHPDTLLSMGNLARKYADQGRWKEAEGLELLVMKKKKQVLGDDHPDTLTSMGNLAATYADQGRWKEAEELKLEVMEKKKQLLGEDHPDTLLSMGNLARTYAGQGRLKEAEELQLMVMKKTKQLLGEDHPDTLLSMGNLAATYADQGRWKEAEELELVVMKKKKLLLGEDHPDTLLSIGNLAATYAGQGFWKEAEELQLPLVNRKLLGEFGSS